MRSPAEVFRFISERPIAQVFLAAALVGIATTVHPPQSSDLTSSEQKLPAPTGETKLILEPKEQAFQRLLNSLEATKKQHGFQFQYARNVNGRGIIQNDEARIPYVLSLQANELVPSPEFEATENNINWDNELTLIKGNRVEIYAVRTLLFLPDSPASSINVLYLMKVVSLDGTSRIPQQKNLIKKTS